MMESHQPNTVRHAHLPAFRGMASRVPVPPSVVTLPQVVFAMFRMCFSSNLSGGLHLSRHFAMSQSGYW